MLALAAMAVSWPTVSRALLRRRARLILYLALQIPILYMYGEKVRKTSNYAVKKK